MKRAILVAMVAAVAGVASAGILDSWTITPCIRYEGAGGSVDFNPFLAGQPSSGWVRNAGVMSPLAAVADYGLRMVSQRPLTSILVGLGLANAFGWIDTREDISNWFKGGSDDKDDVPDVQTATSYTAGGNITIVTSGSAPASGTGAATDNSR